MQKTIQFGSITLGGDNPCCIVAEAGANHEGVYDNAIQLIDAAHMARAHTIKFQHYTAHGLTSHEAKRYWKVAGDEDGFQFNPRVYKDDQLSTFVKIDGIPRERDYELLTYGDQKGILVFSTPFDFESVDHLNTLGIAGYKIASGDITYHAFLDYIARKGKPVILSTGASNVQEIKDAVRIIKNTGNDQIVLLHCTLAYPTPIQHANLNMMLHLQDEFPDCLIGLSDHTPGIDTDVAAAMLGAVMIEKHFTATPGVVVGKNKVGESPDHDIGIGPKEFLRMTNTISENEKNGKTTRRGLTRKQALHEVKQYYPHVLGKYLEKQVDERVELKARAQARRSVITNRSLKKGDIITGEMFRDGTFAVKRPGIGIQPFEIQNLLTKTCKQDILADTVLRWEYFS
jgi:N,N'-diacetyllegionaminate synthase